MADSKSISLTGTTFTSLEVSGADSITICNTHTTNVKVTLAFTHPSYVDGEGSYIGPYNYLLKDVVIPSGQTLVLNDFGWAHDNEEKANPRIMIAKLGASTETAEIITY